MDVIDHLFINNILFNENTLNNILFNNFVIVV